MAWVRRPQVAGEPDHGRQPLMPPHDTAARRLGRPLERQRGGDDRRLAVLEERHELREQTTVRFELVAQRTTQSQVLHHGFTERAHASPPGHASASRDSAERSTLA